MSYLCAFDIFNFDSVFIILLMHTQVNLYLQHINVLKNYLLRWMVLS
jgi:hypothetical protein